MKASLHEFRNTFQQIEHVHWLSDCFHIALFSASEQSCFPIAIFFVSEQTYCARVICNSEWVTVALRSAFLNIHQSNVFTGLLACYRAGYHVKPLLLCRDTMYTTQPCIDQFTLLANWPGSYTCYCGNYTKTRVSRESWPWRRTFSHRTC